MGSNREYETVLLGMASNAKRQPIDSSEWAPLNALDAALTIITAWAAGCTLLEGGGEWDSGDPGVYAAQRGR